MFLKSINKKPSVAIIEITPSVLTWLVHTYPGNQDASYELNWDKTDFATLLGDTYNCCPVPVGNSIETYPVVGYE